MSNWSVVEIDPRCDADVPELLQAFKLLSDKPCARGLAIDTEWLLRCLDFISPPEFSLRFVVVRQDGLPKAIFPVERHFVRSRGVTFTVYTLIANRAVPVEVGLVVQFGDTESWKVLIDYVFRQKDLLKCFSPEGLQTRSVYSEDLERAATELCIKMPRTGHAEYFVDLSDGFDAYWKSRGRNHRRNFKKSRRLEKGPDLTSLQPLSVTLASLTLSKTLRVVVGRVRMKM